MILNATYRLKYTVDKKSEELLVQVDIIITDNTCAPQTYPNVYHGQARVNGVNNTKKDLSHYVNARHAAEEIGHELKKELLIKHKDNKSFKIKKEELI
jgi:hypothetical protein